MTVDLSRVSKRGGRPTKECDIHLIRNELTLIKSYIATLSETKGDELEDLVARFNDNVLGAVAEIEKRLSLARGRSVGEKLRLIVQQQTQLF